MKGYDPVKRALKLRETMITPDGKVLLAGFAGTEQAKDMTAHTRIADDFFRAKVYTKAGERTINPFKREPASIAAQKLTFSDAQKNILVKRKECNAAFLGQINGCNLNCWQCYVDKANKSGNPKYGRYFSAEEYLINFLVWSKRTQNSQNPEEKLNVLRISGGEVFIVPEFIFQMIEAVEKFGLQDYIYIWVDCNLATGDFYWKFLTEEQRKKISGYKNIGFCVCYKGMDEDNLFEITGANPNYFMSQFILHRGLIYEGLDVYSYFYPLTADTNGLYERLASFMELLVDNVDSYAPLRLAMPETKVYGPTQKNLTPSRRKALENQWEAMRLWQEELLGQYSLKELSMLPHEFPARTLI